MTAPRLMVLALTGMLFNSSAFGQTCNGNKPSDTNCNSCTEAVAGETLTTTKCVTGTKSFGSQIRIHQGGKLVVCGDLTMTGGASVTYSSAAGEKGGIVHVTSTGTLTTDDPTELEGDAQMIIYGTVDAGSNNKNIVLRNNNNNLWIMGTLTAHEILMESSTDSLFIYGGSSVTANDKFKMQNTARLCMEPGAALSTKDLINDATDPVVVASGGTACFAYTNNGTVNQDFTADNDLTVCEGPSTSCPGCKWGSATVQSGCTSCGGLLPVDLAEWNVGIWADGVMARWITLSETNNDYFEVQRSSDGIHFETIGTVMGNGTSSEVNQYQFMDRSGDGSDYYRLVQHDFDGAQQIYHAVMANPSNRHLNNAISTPADWPIVLPVASGEYILTVYTGIGQQVLRATTNATTITRSEIADQLPKGFFKVIVQQGANQVALASLLK